MINDHLIHLDCDKRWRQIFDVFLFFLSQILDHQVQTLDKNRASQKNGITPKQSKQMDFRNGWQMA